MVQIKLQNTRVYRLGKLSQPKVTFFILMRYQHTMFPRMFSMISHNHFTEVRND